MIPSSRAASSAPRVDQYADQKRRALESLTGYVVNGEIIKVRNDGDIAARVTHIVYKRGGADFVDVPDLNLLPNQKGTLGYDNSRDFTRLGVLSARGLIYPIRFAKEAEEKEAGGNVTVIEGTTEPGAPVTVVVHSKTRVYHINADNKGNFEISYAASPRGEWREIESGVWELEPYAPGRYEVPEDWLGSGSHKVKITAGDSNRNETADSPDNGGWIGFKKRGVERELRRNERNYFELPLEYDPLDVELSKESMSFKRKWRLGPRKCICSWSRCVSENKRVRVIEHYVRYVRSYFFNGWNPSEDESEILVTPKNNYRGDWTAEATGDTNIKVAIQGDFLKVKPIGRGTDPHSGEVRVTSIDEPPWVGEWHEDGTYAVGLSGSRPPSKYSSKNWTTTKSPAPPTPIPPTPTGDNGTLVVKAVEKGNESNVIDDAAIEVTQDGSEVFTADGSGYGELEPGVYCVTFEYETPSGWKLSLSSYDPLSGMDSCSVKAAVKAGETTTVKGYYKKPEKPPSNGTLVVEAVEKENESNIIWDAAIEVTQGRSEVFFVEGSESRELDPGSYSVSFEYETPSGWKLKGTTPLNWYDPLSGRGGYTVKAGETTTVKARYVRETPEPPEPPDFDIVAPDSIPLYRKNKPLLRTEDPYEGTTYVSVNRTNYSGPITLSVSGRTFDAELTGYYTTWGVLSSSRLTATEDVKLTMGFDRATGAGPPEACWWDKMYVTLTAKGERIVKTKRINLNMKNEYSGEDTGVLVVRAIEKENESNVIGDAAIMVTQGGSEVFTVWGSGSKELCPGQYCVTFEFETPSGWELSCQSNESFELKASEATTIQGYYVKTE